VSVTYLARPSGADHEPAASRQELSTLNRDGRLRIARELHDVVGNGFAAITLQASAAEHNLVTSPDQAAAALRAIQAASAEALRELRVILAVLRSTDVEPAEEPADEAPGLARLDALLAATGAAGVATRVETIGQRRSLPAQVDLAAFRIVQESLTNVLKHTRASIAKVEIAYEHRRLLVEIVDDGRGPADEAMAGGGPDDGRAHHGIVGMRERALAVGGTLEAGPLPGQGFRVRAELPIGPQR
jgi:signal transduction histidine kinase